MTPCHDQNIWQRRWASSLNYFFPPDHRLIFFVLKNTQCKSHIYSSLHVSLTRNVWLDCPSIRVYVRILQRDLKNMKNFYLFYKINIEREWRFTIISHHSTKKAPCIVYHSGPLLCPASQSRWLLVFWSEPTKVSYNHKDSLAFLPMEKFPEQHMIK